MTDEQLAEKYGNRDKQSFDIHYCEEKFNDHGNNLALKCLHYIEYAQSLERRLASLTPSPDAGGMRDGVRWLAKAVCDEAEDYVGIGFDHHNESDALMKLVGQLRLALASPAEGDVDKAAEAIAKHFGVHKRNGDFIYEIGSGHTCSDLDSWQATKRWTRDEFIAELREILASMKEGG